MNIAFVGATSYVAQDLIERFLQTDCKLFLFARNPQNIFWLNDKITFGTLNDFKNKLIEFGSIYKGLPCYNY